MVLIPFFSSLKCLLTSLVSSQNPAISIAENVLHFKGQYSGKCFQLSTQLKRCSGGFFLFLPICFIHILFTFSETLEVN